MSREKDFKDMLISALEMEEKGYEFYKTQNAKANNKITKDMFLFLADNELYHIQDIKKFHHNMEPGKATAGPDLFAEKQSRIKNLDIFLKGIDELDEKISPDDTDKKACEFAMEFEKNGYDYYQKMLAETEDTQAIKFIEFLLD